MLPPRPVRRFALAPLVAAIAVSLAALAIPVALLSAAYSLVRRRAQPGRRPSRLLRVACLVLAWSAGETAALTVLLCLWIVSGFGGRLETEPYQARHYALMEWFLDLVYRAAERACDLRVEVSGPPDAAAAAGRPVIVLCRHAGPGDSLLMVHHLLSVYRRRPRLVMKAALQLDPSVDIVANRVPNVFIPRRRRPARPETGSERAEAALATDRPQTELIRRLAAGLDRDGALVIFPEGGNWTPLRWRRAVDRLRRRGERDLAARAAAMPNVLPPRPGGALAAIEACPEADVIFVAHAGLDTLVSVRDVWQSLRGDLTVRVQWWRVPAGEVPRAAGRDAQVEWLFDWWARVDGWVTAEHAAGLPGTAAGDPAGRVVQGGEARVQS
ncbi:MAG TPA: 1-acyl-sn-glycerol-3-phosphate acyltransferase [Trebonia sp.]|jgi:1-acyl-sn-glycerol-3-phosphate acyltransferase|nr:1-acyl-sn-glycerol-3-phosphate acyltransferase [Trebonia sp.]